jgi:serine/threonine-protein kinase
MAAFLYASRGKRDKIAPRLLQYKPEQVIDGDAAAWTAGMYALLGEKQQALNWLRRAVVLGDANYPWYSKDKNYDSLRGDPQFQAIMSEVKKRSDAYHKEFGGDIPR